MLKHKMDSEKAKYSIMVIDDEMGTLGKLNRRLERIGIDIKPAYIQDVFGLLNTTVPKALLVNANINIKMGLKLLNFVKEKFPALPVLVLTSDCGRLSKLMMARLGISDSIYYPYEIESILSKIKYVLKEDEK